MGLIIGIIVMIILLFFSAMISGSEIAYFSLSASDKLQLSEKDTKKTKLVISMLNKPESLLATILVANNFINVGIVILSTYITEPLFVAIESQALRFIIQIVIVTFLLLLLGEQMPKIYAIRFAQKHALRMAYPLNFTMKLFWPISILLTSSTSLINKRLKRNQHNLSMDELSQAIELASDDLSEEKEILESIVKFGNIQVREIMKPRLKVIALDINDTLNKVISVIVESGYSRIPVYEGDFDHIRGILYIKDLLPYLKIEDKENFNWQKLIRSYYFVPESKKINELLEEFQQKKIHMAVIIDEYGGTSGVVTMEDILEEIVGDISDESDIDEITYRKKDENTWIFDARVSLNDFSKIMDCDSEIFDKISGDADSLAGLILEISREIPAKNEKINIEGFIFKITSVDNRRIKQIEVSYE
jgi:gliding motility-associated protein GldE